MWIIGHVDCFLVYSSWLNKFVEHTNPVQETSEILYVTTRLNTFMKQSPDAIS